MSFKPIQKLNVARTLSSGERVAVGVLAQNRQGVFFQYVDRYLQSDGGQWQPARFYDVTYSPHPFNEHATVFGGYGKAPPIKVMQKLATSAGYGSWNDARQVIEEISEVISQFAHLAQQQGISKTTESAITKTLDQRKQENAALFLQQ